jgi:hypothetical protein
MFFALTGKKMHNPLGAFSRFACLERRAQQLTPQKRKECPRDVFQSKKVPKTVKPTNAVFETPHVEPFLVKPPEEVKSVEPFKHVVVGQNKNMAQLTAWFKSPQHPRVVLWGSTGTGKTMAAYQLPGNIVEFNPLSSHIYADLTRSLKAAATFGQLVVLLDDVDAMPSSVLADVVKAVNQLSKVQTNPLVITCTSLHTLPPCLTKDSLVLHFARVQPAPMRELLARVATSLSLPSPKFDHIISLANGDVRQALSMLQHSASSPKDLAGSPFQMVLAAMNRRKPFFPPVQLVKEVQHCWTLPFKSPKLVRERVAMQPNMQCIPMEEEAGYVNLYGEFEACIFAYYLVPRHAIVEQPGAKDYLSRRVWPFEQAFINCAPDLSTWRQLMDGASLAQDVQTVAMKELPSLMLDMIMSKARLNPREVKDTAHTAIWHPRQKWDPCDDLVQRINRLRL